jgi:hypothetical protein
MEISMTADSLLALWRTANKNATDAENELFEATMRYISGRGPMPSAEENERARALRAEATQLLERATRSVGLPAPAFNFTSAADPSSPVQRRSEGSGGSGASQQ